MDTSQITELLVKQTLQAWQRQRPTPAEWQTLDYVRGEVDSDAYFKQHVLALIEKKVQAGRDRVHSTLSLAADWQTALIEDFQACDDDLLNWSLLYYCLCDPSRPQLKQVKYHTGIDLKRLNRSIHLTCTQVAHSICQQETAAQQRLKQVRLINQLPLPEYRQLYGPRDVIDDAYRALHATDNTGFVSLQGIGGIGKTAQARELAKRVAESDYFQDVLWISARQEWFNADGMLESNANPALTLSDILDRLAEKLYVAGAGAWSAPEKIVRLSEILATKRRLIVLDNLETVEEITSITDKCFPLAQFSRFLLTSREKVPDSNIVQSIRVPTLSEADSFRLIRGELTRHASPRLMGDDELAQIYALVDGLPLPLKLIAAQLAQNLPLARILDGLTPRSDQQQQSEAQHFAEMYRFIYDRALNLLPVSTRRLLFALSDIPSDGCQLEWIETIAGSDKFKMTPTVCHSAIKRLEDLSLIECDYPYQVEMGSSALYRLHRLTATHLRNLLQSKRNPL